LQRRRSCIGHVGLSGRTTGPHLHWGMRYRGSGLIRRRGPAGHGSQPAQGQPLSWVMDPVPVAAVTLRRLATRSTAAAEPPRPHPRSCRSRVNGGYADGCACTATACDISLATPAGRSCPSTTSCYRAEASGWMLATSWCATSRAAAHAADAYARATGQVGVRFGTSGPGATNLVTGIATAHMDSIPMVVITGQVPSARHRQRRLPGNRHLRHHPAHRQALPG
jgi:hypothetical protein